MAGSENEIVMEMTLFHLKIKPMNNDLLYIKQFNLRPGDTIVAPKSGINMVQHFVIYLGNDAYGKHWICENVFGKGVIMTQVQDFFSSYQKITRIEKFLGTNLQRKELVQRSLSRLGKPYDLINYNCEHFVNDVRNRSPKSNQVNNVIGISFGLLLLGLMVASD